MVFDDDALDEATTALCGGGAVVREGGFIGADTFDMRLLSVIYVLAYALIDTFVVLA